MAKREAEKSTGLTAFMKGGDISVSDTEAMAGALTETIEESSTGASGTDYLSFSGKTGVYACGREKESIDPDDLYLVEIQSAVEGWICWKGNKPVARVAWSVYRKDQAVRREDLEDHGPYKENLGEGWHQSLGFGILTMDGLTKSISFSTSSVSGRNAIGDLLGKVRDRLAAKEAENLPVISFDAEEFEAQGKKNFKPVLDVETWVTREAAAAFFEGELTMQQLIDGKKPKAKRSKKK
jgi:hypothetical protein